MDFLASVVLVFVLLDILISLAGHNRKRDRERMERVERKLNLLHRHNGLEFAWPPPGASSVEILVAEGQKIRPSKLIVLIVRTIPASASKMPKK